MADSTDRRSHPLGKRADLPPLGIKKEEDKADSDNTDGEGEDDDTSLHGDDAIDNDDNIGYRCKLKNVVSSFTGHSLTEQERFEVVDGTMDIMQSLGIC